jgi:hypothetical protein
LAGKLIDGAGEGATIAGMRQADMTAPMFAKDCGVCHVGGGQLEYDLDMKAYGDPTSGDTGSVYIYQSPTAAGAAGGIVATSAANYPQLLGDNKAEVDCMMCHMNKLQTGAAWYKSMGCDGVNMPGPADNINCNGYKDVPFSYPPIDDLNNPDTRFTYISGTIYDSYNRNISVSMGWFKQSAAAGIGALINLNNGTLTGVPSKIPGSSIASVPNSDNCAMCHARTNSDTIGLPMEAASYGGMTTGFGNFFRMTPPGGAFDWDKIAADGTCTGDCSNSTLWSEFGCKTGMGKRAQRAGVGNQDRFGFGICLGCASFNAMMGDMSTGWWTGMDHIAGNADDGVCGLPSVQAACNAKAGTTLQGSAGQWMGVFEDANMTPKKIAGKLEDTDVHDKAGMKCATCHNMVSGTFPSRTVGTYTLPAVSLDRIDHQIAQGWSTLEKANDVVDGTVSCEACHIDRSHANAGTAPIPAHTGFPSLHFVKIDCRTCHIPEVYSAPGRLLLRDWTAGAYRQSEGSNGNANHFDFAYDFMDGAAVPMKPLKQWMKVVKNGTDVEIKIAPGLPSMLPMWVGNSAGASTVYTPLITRDATAAAALVSKNNPGFNIRLNGTSDMPPFQGFQLTDPLKIDSAAKIAAMRAELATTGAGLATHNAYPDTKLNLQPFFFDPSHGVVAKGKALGANGCTDCHSASADFFNMNKDMLKNGMMQMADYDCGGDDTTYNTGGFANTPTSGMCGMFDSAQMGGNGNGICDQTEMMACRGYIATNLFPMFGMPADVANVMPVDGINMMQLFAVREGAMASGCDTRMSFFGMDTGCLPADMYSRDEIRAYYKKNLQQVQAGGANKVTGSIKVGSDFTSYDLGAKCKTFGPDGMPNGEAACTNGGYVNTVVSNKLLLGYTTDRQAALTNLNNCAACHTPPAHIVGTGNPYPACTTCHTTHDNGASIPTIDACKSCHGAKYTDAQFTVLAAGIHLPPKTITVTQTANGSISPYTYTGFLTGMNSTYQIQPNAGYHVADVVVDGVSAGAVTSYTFSNIQTDHTITATYAANSGYTITATATGSGSISPEGVTSLLGGMSQNYVITPAAGYRIDKVLVDGVNKGAITSYIFTNVNADHTIAASFVSDTYTITASVLSGSGSISPAGATTVNGGGSQTYSFTPAAGYKISYVTVNGAAVTLSADGTYTFTNVKSNFTIGVSFVPITYTITVTQTANGSIKPQTYNGFNGGNQTYIIKANAGYHIADVLVDGSSVGTVTSYTFTNIQADHSITATFAENPPATITATAGANGSISPSGSVTVLSGTNKTYSFTPDSGYRINQVFVDGVSKGTLSGYTFINITAGDHTISVTFNPTITASAGTGGTISPAGTSTVSSGGSKTYTIKANAGYQIADVLVDGSSVGAVTTYAFTNVTTPHTISATFELK